MSEPTWRADIGLLPSRNTSLLQQAVGRRIRSVTRYGQSSNEEIMGYRAEVGLPLLARDLFSQRSGPVLVVLEGALPIQVGHSEPLMSITVRPADIAAILQSAKVVIDAVDPVFSEPRFGRVAGMRIGAIRVLQRFLHIDRLVRRGPDGRITGMTHPRALGRPRESVLLLDLEGGAKLGFSGGVLGPVKDFIMFTELEAASIDSQDYPEVLVVQ